uniref:TetR family transcriptional regulator n=1 Tax=uncultured Alphaproteobacteria bacterium TaxID=91750 RepID=H5SK17_9PROT|nr:TetR family transcriptional regulator [uncultured Alphaproteobacteria bacterium]
MPVQEAAARRAPERGAGSREEILRVATEEFAEKGLAGARVDEIAARTRTSKRMIYYYFGSKEALYVACLEEAYARIRALENALRLDHLPPVPALVRMVEHTFDYHVQHPDFVRLVMNENLERGRYIARSERIRGLNVSVIENLRRILERGAAEGVFRPGVDPLQLHATISALCFHVVGNRHTFGTIFGFDPCAPENLARRRREVVRTVLAAVLTPAAAAATEPAGHGA